MRLSIQIVVLSVLPQLIQGQIVTDGTMGTAPAQALEAGGTAYTINESLGERAGDNLFHSFDTFNINTEESAMFTGADAIKNVISRVTGGEVSNIDGLLASTIGSADLYFLNPAGVIFGPNARLNLTGAFHVSTADHILLGEADLFYSKPLAGELLSTAAPKAFGFLDDPVDAPVVKEGIKVDSSQLVLADGKTLSLVGGSVEVKNGARLNAANGQVNLIGLSRLTGDAVFNDGDLDVSDFSEPGDVLIKDSSAVNVDGGGRIYIRGGQVVIEDSDVSAETNDDGTGQ